MKKALLSLSTILFLVLLYSFSEDNNPLSYYNDTTSKLKLNHFDANDVNDGYSIFGLKSINNNKKIISEGTYNKEHKLITSVDFEVVRKRGITLYDMNMMIGSSLEIVSEPSLDLSVNQYIEFPDNPKEGDMLKDAVLKGVLYNSGNRFAAIEISCLNRKVLEITQLETPFGTLDCYCVEFTFISKIGIVKFTNTRRFWYNKEYGIIKTDRHSKKGKYTGKSMLDKV